MLTPEVQNVIDQLNEQIGILVEARGKIEGLFEETLGVTIWSLLDVNNRALARDLIAAEIENTTAYIAQAASSFRNVT